MHVCAGTDDDFPDHDGTGYATAIHEAAHAVAMEWTGAGKVFGISTGLARVAPWRGVFGQMRFNRPHLDEAVFQASEEGPALLRGWLIAMVAAPLAVARVTGWQDESWAGLVTAHLRAPSYFPPVDDEGAGTRPDYVRARKLCNALGLTLAEGLSLGEAFLDEPGVMDAVVRVAEATLATAPAYYLGREDFLEALDLPAPVQARRDALWAAACALMDREEGKRIEALVPPQPLEEAGALTFGLGLLIYVLLKGGLYLLSNLG